MVFGLLHICAHHVYVHTSVSLFRLKLIDRLSQSGLFYAIVHTCSMFYLYSVQQVRSFKKKMHCK